MEVLKDELASHREMAIVERFGIFVDYTYPIAINIRRTHQLVRDLLITSMFEQANLFAQAGKTSQVSRLYAADAGLAQPQAAAACQCGARQTQAGPICQARPG